jgi:nucleoside-diphosphate-sugar epimerase
LAYQNGFLDAFRDDSQSIVNLLSYLDGHPEARLVFFASSYVYSGLDIAQFWGETAILHPDHNFGLTKTFFEQLLLRTHPNSVVFRLSSVFGQGNALHPNAIANMAKECMQDGELTIWGHGTRKMQYVFIDDVMKYVLRSANLSNGIYNLGGHEYETVAQTAKAIANHFGGEAVFLEDKKEGQTLPFMKNDKLIAEAGQDLFTPFSTALPRYLDTL